MAIKHTISIETQNAYNGTKMYSKIVLGRHIPREEDALISK